MSGYTNAAITLYKIHFIYYHKYQCTMDREGCIHKLLTAGCYNSCMHLRSDHNFTSKIKHAIKHKTSPARLAQLLQPSLAFCFSLQPMTAYRPGQDGMPKISTPLYLGPPLGVKPSDMRNDPWRRKTRMIGLTDSERISMMRSAILSQSMCVTDGWIDGIGEVY